VSESKFRAWDVNEKCWIPPDQIAITGDGKIITKTSREEDVKETWAEETIPIVIQYYKDLQDKNSVDVYDGDILNYKHVIYTDCSRTEIEEIRDEVLIGIVLHTPLVTVIKPYSKKVRAFGWDHERGEGFLLGLESEEIEKVGNIFENPELLQLTNQPRKGNPVDSTSC
jgi:hypothetical protein